MITKVNPGLENYSIARKFGDLLAAEMQKNDKLYFFSPDETTSNKLDAVYQSTERLWDLPTKAWDLPESQTGRIVELLSENTLFAAMVGHIMNGEPAVMASYEAFYSIILSQILQQIKFIKQSEAVSWRPKYPAINLLSTSMCWRQDHNGYSHQSPALISSLLNVPSNKVNCLFPADDISAEAVWNFMMKSENVVNLATFDKNENPRWIDSQHAEYLLDGGGASVFNFASDPDPELVLIAAGDIPLRETLAAVKILRDNHFGRRIRVVYIAALSYRHIGTTARPLTQDEYNERFANGTPIIASFHGYPDTLEHILRCYGAQDLEVHGFIEEGSTTTPMEMLNLNHNSRYDIAAAAARRFGREDLVARFEAKIRENHEHATLYGTDSMV